MRRYAALTAVLVVLMVTAALLVTGCQQDPVKEAQGYAIEEQARQEAADREQARRHREEEHQLRMAEREATLDDRIAAGERLLLWVSVATGAAAVVIILATAGGLSYAVIGASRAAVRAAEMRAHLIPLNPGTRQFPLLAYEVRGVWRVYNANTGQLVRFDKTLGPHPQLVTASGAVQLAGAIAQEAAKAAGKAARTDPGGAAAGVAAVNPPLVIGTAKQLEKQRDENTN